MSVSAYPKRQFRLRSSNVVQVPALPFPQTITFNFQFTDPLLLKGLDDPISIYSFYADIPQLRGIKVIDCTNFIIRTRKYDNSNPAEVITFTDNSLISDFNWSTPYEFDIRYNDPVISTDRFGVELGSISITIDALDLSEAFAGRSLNLDVYLDIRSKYVEGV